VADGVKSTVNWLNYISFLVYVELDRVMSMFNVYCQSIHLSTKDLDHVCGLLVKNHHRCQHQIFPHYFSACEDRFVKGFNNRIYSRLYRTLSSVTHDDKRC